ncbi:unnamed protein product [Closterium sp. NIES-65]|nr:unnamed protein product [Closterium sp. NIES-65]
MRPFMPCSRLSAVSPPLASFPASPVILTAQLAPQFFRQTPPPTFSRQIRVLNHLPSAQVHKRAISRRLVARSGAQSASNGEADRGDDSREPFQSGGGDGGAGGESGSSESEARRLALDDAARAEMRARSELALAAMAEGSRGAAAAVGDAPGNAAGDTGGSGGSGDGGAWKWAVRKGVWDELEARDVARPPRPVHHRIPNFDGADKAAAMVREGAERGKKGEAECLITNPLADMPLFSSSTPPIQTPFPCQLASLPEFQAAGCVKVNPDTPQKAVRLAALQGELQKAPAHPPLHLPRLQSAAIIFSPLPPPLHLPHPAPTLPPPFSHSQQAPANPATAPTLQPHPTPHQLCNRTPPRTNSATAPANLSATHSPSSSPFHYLSNKLLLTPQPRLRTGNKLLLTPQPRLRTGFFSRLSADHIPPDQLLAACTAAGVARHGVPVALEDKVAVDMVVLGSVAVDPTTGARLGKGEGFAELEYGILRWMGAVTDDTPVVTTVHDCQLVAAGAIPTSNLRQHDLPVDIICTPTQIIRVSSRIPKPSGDLVRHRLLSTCFAFWVTFESTQHHPSIPLLASVILLSLQVSFSSPCKCHSPLLASVILLSLQVSFSSPCKCHSPLLASVILLSLQVSFSSPCKCHSPLLASVMLLSLQVSCSSPCKCHSPLLASVILLSLQVSFSSPCKCHSPLLASVILLSLQVSFSSPCKCHSPLLASVILLSLQVSFSSPCKCHSPLLASVILLSLQVSFSSPCKCHSPLLASVILLSLQVSFSSPCKCHSPLLASVILLSLQVSFSSPCKCHSPLLASVILLSLQVSFSSPCQWHLLSTQDLPHSDSHPAATQKHPVFTNSEHLILPFHPSPSLSTPFHPAGIYWHLLSPQKLAQIRILQQLKSTLEAQTGAALPLGPDEELPPVATRHGKGGRRKEGGRGGGKVGERGGVGRGRGERRGGEGRRSERKVWRRGDDRGSGGEEGGRE